MPEEPVEPPNEHHWWEMQLGLRLPRSLRHPSPLVRLEPSAEPAETSDDPDPAVLPPPDERRWWDMQLGNRRRETRRD